MPNTVLLFAVFGTALGACLPKIFLCELGRPVLVRAGPRDAALAAQASQPSQSKLACVHPLALARPSASGPPTDGLAGWFKLT